jgi:SAM-dependent methyltransferase
MLTSAEYLLRAVDQFETIRTDRLHVAVAGVLLGKKVEIYPNSYFKNRAMYDFSFKRYPGARFIEWSAPDTSRCEGAHSSLTEEDGERILQNRYLAGKFLPLNPKGVYHLLLKSSVQTRNSESGLPIPPKQMWEGYGMSEKEYLQSGQRHMAAMQRILASAGSSTEKLNRVLDLGCAAGRMLRFYPYQEGRSELWGVDINAPYISWCQNHLSPPFLFATVTTVPHLPFEDNFFDLVYCGSVFTHITDLADAWLLEVRRVLRKGGYAYITVQDKTSVEILLSRYGGTVAVLPEADRTAEKLDGEPGTSAEGIHLIHEFDKTVDLSSLDYATFSFSSDPVSNIFYDTKFLTDKWSRFVEIVSVTPRAYGCQTAVLCRK